MLPARCHTRVVTEQAGEHEHGEGDEVQACQPMTKAGLIFTWHEFNAAHAFLRDEGPRFDPKLALRCYGMAVDLFRSKNDRWLKQLKPVHLCERQSRTCETPPRKDPLQKFS